MINVWVCQGPNGQYKVVTGNYPPQVSAGWTVTRYVPETK